MVLHVVEAYFVVAVEACSVACPVVLEMMALSWPGVLGLHWMVVVVVWEQHFLHSDPPENKI